MARAITVLFQRQQSLEINTRNYSVWGASAGARMAVLISSYGPDAFGGAVSDRPVCVVMLYTGHSDYVREEPAIFVTVGAQDDMAPPAVMRQRIETLQRTGTAVEFQVYPNVGHGFGLATGSPAQGWIDDAIQFWRAQFSL